MVVYAYLRAYQDLARAVIMDIVVPGVPPWEEFLRQPFLWHFALHSVADLPERLVQGRQQEYFDYFYAVLSADPKKITDEARRAYAAAYATDGALTAGFSWFRAFAQDAAGNRRASEGPHVTTPVLYLRGEQERGGDISAYADGLRGAGLTHVEQVVVSGAGHFTQEEAPEETWRLIASFAQL
jgi:pimeloyl-ACP methyl ester carboxylesterase